MTTELIEWFFILVIIASSIGFGIAVGFGLGRKSMLEQIIGRPPRKAKQPVKLNIRHDGNIRFLEVVQ